MIRKISLCLFIIITIGSLVPFLSSCGNDSDSDGGHYYPPVNCLTKSSLLCMPEIRIKLSNLIKQECKEGISVENTVNVFGKSWKVINFSRPFNECFTDFEDFTSVTNTDSSSILFNIYHSHSDLSEINSNTDFLNTYITDGISSLEIRPYTNLKEFIKEECWSEIILGEKISVGGKEWLELTFPGPFTRCYNFLQYELVSKALANSNSIGLRIDNNAPTVATVEELLNLTFSQSVDAINR